MEKCDNRTLARTLSWPTAVTKIILIAILFLPGNLTMNAAAPRPTAPATIEIAKQTKKIEKKSKELIKIKSIVKSHRPEIAETEAWEVSKAVHDESAKRNLDPMLVLAVIKVESGFRNNAVSPVGARGIMQIMPKTGKFLREKIFGVDKSETEEFSPDYLDDPSVNIKLGVYYLNGLKERFRSLSLALLAYNLGPSEMQNRLDNQIYFSGDYAAAVFNAYRKYKNTQNTAF